jgi:hypothetical protein
MNAITAERWMQAQQEERKFWDEHDRAEHRAQQRFIAGLLNFGYGDPPISVVDFGGGPTSLLLKGTGIRLRHVVDPLPLTDDEKKRYAGEKIVYHQTMAENFDAEPKMFEEVWGYNCLQHVQVPEMILDRVRALQPKRIRWFEWVNVPESIVHPHMIDSKWLINQILRNSEYQSEFFTTGTHVTPTYSQEFIAIVAERKS